MGVWGAGELHRSLSSTQESPPQVFFPSSWRSDLHLSAYRPFLWYDFSWHVMCVCVCVCRRLCVYLWSYLISGKKKKKKDLNKQNPRRGSGLWSESISQMISNIDALCCWKMRLSSSLHPPLCSSPPGLRRCRPGFTSWVPLSLCW